PSPDCRSDAHSMPRTRPPPVRAALHPLPRPCSPVTGARPSGFPRPFERFEHATQIVGEAHRPLLPVVEHDLDRGAAGEQAPVFGPHLVLDLEVLASQFGDTYAHVHGLGP